MLMSTRTVYFGDPLQNLHGELVLVMWGTKPEYLVDATSAAPRCWLSWTARSRDFCCLNMDLSEKVTSKRFVGRRRPWQKDDFDAHGLYDENMKCRSRSKHHGVCSPASICRRSSNTMAACHAPADMMGSSSSRNSGSGVRDQGYDTSTAALHGGGEELAGGILGKLRIANLPEHILLLKKLIENEAPGGGYQAFDEEINFCHHWEQRIACSFFAAALYLSLLCAIADMSLQLQLLRLPFVLIKSKV